MPTVYVQVQVLAADQAAAVDYLSGYGSYPLSVEIVPYPGPSGDPATNYGNNISCVMDGSLDAALQAMPGLFPGCAVQTIQRTYPYWKAYSKAVNWDGWLNAQGLQPRVVSP